jgi:predicted esterase
MLRTRLLPTLSSSLICLACASDDGQASGDGSSESGADSGTTEVGDGDGDGAPGDGDGDGDGAPGDGDGAPTGACDGLQAGLNSGFDVDGLARSFYLDLPSDVESGGPWPVVFSWHGLGDTAQNFRNLFAGAVDGPQMSFILVTPEDTDHAITVPLAGEFPMDWDTFMVAANGVGNKEVALFDAVLGCLAERWGVDEDRVYTAGFSLGSVTSDMLATVRGEQLAAVATYSGGYWSNPQNVDFALGAVAEWPAYVVNNPYPQMLIHGGMTDEFVVVPGVYTMSFHAFNVNDTVFLSERGHPLIVCDHGAGHTAPASVPPSAVLEFFAAHSRGAGSPWAGGLPDSGFASCVAML